MVVGKERWAGRAQRCAQSGGTDQIEANQAWRGKKASKFGHDLRVPSNGTKWKMFNKNEGFTHFLVAINFRRWLTAPTKDEIPPCGSFFETCL